MIDTFSGDKYLQWITLELTELSSVSKALLQLAFQMSNPINVNIAKESSFNVTSQRMYNQRRRGYWFVAVDFKMSLSTLAAALYRSAARRRHMNFVYVTTSVTVNSAPRLFRVRAVAGTVYDGIVAKAFLPSITKDNCTAPDSIDENLKKFKNAWVHL